MTLKYSSSTVGVWLANALVVLSSTAEGGEIEFRNSVGIDTVEIMGSFWALVPLLLVLTLSTVNCYRLPKNVLPEKYTLEIITNLGDHGQNFSFDGKVWIHVLAVEPTDSITLHSVDLDIDRALTKVTVEGDEAGKNLVNGTHYVKKVNFFVIELSEKLLAGNRYVVYIPYRGNLTQGLAGYYRSSYQDRRTGETKWVAVTQFEPSDARRAFPCMDEPAMKAKFQVNLGRMEKYKSISNMPIAKTEPMKDSPGWFWDRFEESKNMSTYLVAYIVCDFEYKSAMTEGKHPVEYRIWARPDAINQTDYALEVGPKILQYYEKYFDYDYPLPKMDMIALPDFNSGAMENWGLVTYSKQSVASVIAHELAHQWFGNLVTMSWWTDLWLNEGFATYVAILGVNHVHPEWKVFDIDSTENFLILMNADSLKSSHPVSVPVRYPSDINQIFDTISYKKGMYILRMMYLFLGEDVFRKGVNQYIKDNLYGNAKQDDLWEMLTTQAHIAGALPKDLTIKVIMDTWTLQTGFPVITAVRDYEHGTATVTQKRFLADVKTDDDDEVSSSDESCWIVPLSHTNEKEVDFNNTKAKTWVACNKTETQVSEMPSADQWVIFNIKATAALRVNYDEKNWDLLTKVLNGGKHESIDVINRVALIDDVMHLAWTKDLDYKIALDMLDYLTQETEYLPWRTALSNLNVINRLLRRTLAYGDFRTFMKSLLTPLVEKMGDIKKVPNGNQAIKLHSLIVSWASRLDMGNCRTQARELFHEWMESSDPDNNNPIPQDVRSNVYCSALKYGGEEEWSFAWKRYKKANVAAEKMTLLSALGCTRETWLLYRLLDLAHKDDTDIRKQDSHTLFASIARNEVGLEIARNFFISNIKQIHDFHGVKASRLSRYLTVLGDQMFSDNELQEYMSFIEKNGEYLKQSQRSVNQSIESVMVSNKWHKAHYKNFTKLLAERV
uniref:Aminopeptidase n=1 Tax=Timema cristinae TaxID=61476 RepID=A0A7R9CDD5_TIMCR|nr:unnamed protein product [Timema cristinae]